MVRIKKVATAAAPAVVALLAGGLNWLFNSRFSMNLWDNFETFTPVTLAGHSLWLQGQVPVLNLQQCLGTPVMGNAQSGLLYFPTTLGLLLLRSAGIGDQNLPELMGILHLALGLAGWDVLLRSLGVRREFSIVCATGLAACGFFSVGVSMFQHIGSEYGWLPWVLWSVSRLIEGVRPLLWSAAFALFWFLCAAGSHAQMLVYITINVALFALVLAWARARLRAAAVSLTTILLWMPLLALPVLSYSLAIRKIIQRSSAIPREWFFEAALTPEYLWGLVTPFFHTGGNLMATETSLFAWAGPWLLAAILLVRSPRGQRKEVYGLLAIGLLFLDFSLGEKGLIYPLTYGLPVWSSFRWPFKFTYHWIAMFAILAALMLEREWPRIPARWRFAAAGMVALVPLLFAAPESPAQWLLWAAQAALLLSLAAAWRAPQVICLVYLCSTLWAASEQKKHRYTERYGEYGAEYFGLENAMQSRMVPLSLAGCDDDWNCLMQPLGNFDSATVNGYSSLSGHIMGTSAEALNILVSSSAWGVISPQVAELAAGRGLYRSLAARYYLVSDRDLGHYKPLLEGRGLVTRKSGPGWTVFEDQAAKGLVSVPDQVVAQASGQMTTAIFGTGDANWQTAFVEGLPGPVRASRTTVSALAMIPGRGLRFQVENASAENSLVQAALFPWPFLRARAVGGPDLDTYAANGVATAILIPPGRFTVELAASLAPLLQGVLVALTALAVGLSAHLALSRRR